jgi:hypothetical protein
MEYDKPKMLQACGETARMARGFVSSSVVGRSCYEVKLFNDHSHVHRSPQV